MLYDPTGATRACSQTAVPNSRSVRDVAACVQPLPLVGDRNEKFDYAVWAGVVFAIDVQIFHKQPVASKLLAQTKTPRHLGCILGVQGPLRTKHALIGLDMIEILYIFACVFILYIYM